MGQPCSNRAPLALIIEDDNDTAAIFEQALQAAGYATDIAPDGETALLCLNTRQPRLICLDLHLPRISGITLLRAVQANEYLANSAIIILTADPGLAEPLRTEVDLIILKPVEFRHLRDSAARLRPR